MADADFTPDLPQLLDIWQEALLSVADLCEPLTDEQWQAPTPCPGWSVADVVAHLVDIEQTMAGTPRPDHEPKWDALPHVTSDFGRFTEVGVDVRRTRPKAEVLQELRETATLRRAQLDAVPEGAEVIGPFGNPTSMERLLRIRIFDTWLHEQDIRTAAGPSGGWGSSAAYISFQQMTRALPILWARDVKPPVGSVARVTITGPELTGAFASIAGEDGRGSVVPDGSPADVGLTVTWPDFAALAAGRVPTDEPALRSRVVLEGDATLGEALLAALAMTP